MRYDDQRPRLDLKIFDDIYPDRNVPVIVEFTKYDQFRRNDQIHLEDFGSSDDNIRAMRKDAQANMGCDELVETTAAALNDNVVASMFLAVQRDQLLYFFSTDKVYWLYGW
ncbi:hypothetical protein EDB89DRAFT_2072607 [Lactarius sanguifluus]|nr:hypothetical protein EDB89DRAFT_2072607 [Lactarius sanguifluus]